MSVQSEILAVFGVSSEVDPTRAADASSVHFARTQYQIEIAGKGSRGLKLTAREALEEYGWPVLRQLADYQTASVISRRGEPFDRLEAAAESLGLPFERAAELAGLDAAIDAFGCCLAAVQSLQSGNAVPVAKL